MSQIQTTNWSQTAANNNAAAPNGMPEGMAPSGVNDSVREVMSALKIDWCNVHGTDNSGNLLSTAGTSTAYTLTFTTAPATLYTSFIFTCKIHTTSGASPTININGLGAKTIRRMAASGYSDIGAGDLVTDQHILAKYDATLDRVILLSPVATGFTDPMTTRGDVIVRNSSNATARLAVGAANRVLGSDGTDPSWRQITNSDCASTVYTAGTAATTGATGVVRLADVAAMEAETSGRVVTADLAVRAPWAPKAWCYVTVSGGTPTLAASYNVTSITDSAAGRFVVNFSTPFSTANYAAICSCSQDQGVSVRFVGMDENAAAPTASAFPIGIINSGGAYVDPAEFTVVFYGDQ